MECRRKRQDERVKNIEYRKWKIEKGKYNIENRRKRQEERFEIQTLIYNWFKK
ncbi:hypothetical protein [Flavobacterium frigidimaris]|uniref:hypothetical protein n=1 Tax=Flavobacterium frigidimaris TaxID=262320 RepID=UPI001A963C7B|nr:hypothetical protein [Flavobacterium frigidimaris]